MESVEIIHIAAEQGSLETRAFLFKCPHCQDYIQVAINEVNCSIFRHGTYKNTLQPIEPHMPKDKCEELVSKNLAYGCCKPFKMIVGDPTRVEICGYI